MGYATEATSSFSGRRRRLPAALRSGTRRVPPGADRDAARRPGRDGRRRPRAGRRSGWPGPPRAERAAPAGADPLLGAAVDPDAPIAAETGRPGGDPVEGEVPAGAAERRVAVAVDDVG